MAALLLATGCQAGDPMYDWLLNDWHSPPPHPMAPLTFGLQISDVTGSTDFITAIAEGDSVELYTIVLDVNSPETGSMVQIREMSGDRIGRVVFRGVPSTSGNLDGLVTVDPATGLAEVRFTWQGTDYSYVVRLTNVLQINRTLYLYTWATRGALTVDPCATDAGPPVIDFDLATASLWPPNNQMVRVATGVRATDDQDSAPSLTISVTSNEHAPGASGDWDIVDTGAGGFEVWLRAGRNGDGNGREYTISATAGDACGNTSTAQRTVTVPKSQGRR